jgi:hypothetical protein
VPKRITPQRTTPYASTQLDSRLIRSRFEAKAEDVMSMMLASLILIGVLAASSTMGAKGHVIKLSAAALEGLPRTTSRAKTHESSTEVSYEGVSLGDVVRKAGGPSGEAIKGPKLKTVVIVKASDGYEAVFALPELDPAFTAKVVLLADRREGVPLSGKEGMYRLIVPDEKRQARWVRQVVSIELREIQ